MSVRAASVRGFSLIELLVVLAVATILLGLLMPTFRQLRESARQIVCANNQHQIGIALQTYATDNNDRLPYTVFAERPERPQDMMALHAGGGDSRLWDGIGLLYKTRLLRSPETFYCPAHKGDHIYAADVDLWQRPGARPLYSNYHYRGLFENRSISEFGLDRLQTMQQGMALMSDGLRLKSDFNHETGANILRTDLSVRWVVDSERTIITLLPDSATQTWPTRIWKTIDIKIADSLVK